MDALDAIANRRTVRDFSRKPISKPTLQKIIRAGLQAPSNNHLRQWEFIVINDRQTRIAAIAGINQNLSAKESKHIIDKWGLTDEFQREMYLEAIPKQYRMLLEAACLIVPCFLQESHLLKPKSLSTLNGFASIWCCIENILVAASAEGIYGVTRIPFEKETPLIKKALNIPKEYSFPCYLALGYPKDQLSNIRQHNLKAKEKIHYNKW